MITYYSYILLYTVYSMQYCSTGLILLHLNLEKCTDLFELFICNWDILVRKYTTSTLLLNDFCKK